jgi:hypothetical protein
MWRVPRLNPRFNLVGRNDVAILDFDQHPANARVAAAIMLAGAWNAKPAYPLEIIGSHQALLPFQSILGAPIRAMILEIAESAKSCRNFD